MKLTYQEIDKLSDVTSFAAANGKMLFYRNIEEIVSYFDNKIIFRSKNYVDYFTFDRYFFANETIPKAGGILFLEKEVKYFKDLFINKLINNHELLGSFENRTVKMNIATGDSVELFPDNIFYFLAFENLIAADLDGKIQLRSLLDGSEIWNFDVNSFGSFKYYNNEDLPYKVQQVICVNKDILWTLLFGGRLIGINIKNGKLLHDINFLKIISLVYPNSINYSVQIHFDEDNEEIIWLTNQNLIKIDLNTLEVKHVKDYSIGPREQHWRFMTSTIKDNLIYFTGDYGWKLGVANVIGVMDKKSGEVLWSQALEKTRGLPTPPQVSENKLYVLSASKTLYIFERTQ